MARKANHTSQETKNNIRNTFIELYKEFEIQKITINLLCRKAEINRGTFYYYYSDIYDLLSHIELQTIEELKSVYPILINGTLFGEYNDLEKITDFIEKNGDVFVLFTQTRPNLHFQKEIRRFLTSYLITRFNVESYDFSLKQQGILEYITNGQLGCIVWWLNNGQSIPIEKFLKIIYNINRKGAVSMLFENFDITDRNGHAVKAE